MPSLPPNLLLLWVPVISPLASINTLLQHFILPFSSPFLPPVHFAKKNWLIAIGSLTMFFAQDAVDYPVVETGFTASEIQELLSLFHSSPPASSPNSSSEGSNRAIYFLEERKQRRKISNQESARRSRWRKKRHLENLTDQVKGLKTQNQELKFRLDSILKHSHILYRENDQLILESVSLWARLSDLCNALVAMQQQQ